MQFQSSEEGKQKMKSLTAKEISQHLASEKVTYPVKSGSITQGNAVCESDEEHEKRIVLLEAKQFIPLVDAQEFFQKLKEEQYQVGLQYATAIEKISDYVQSLEGQLVAINKIIEPKIREQERTKVPMDYTLSFDAKETKSLIALLFPRSEQSTTKPIGEKK
jgi:hypothetical protein